MDDSDDEEYFWYSDSELEEQEIDNYETDQSCGWTQTIYTDSSTTRPVLEAGASEEP